MHATLLTVLLVAGAESPGTIAEQPAAAVTSWFGSMFQTCHAPSFGYYPASYGYHYRRTYNYRHLFDYPGHAAWHAPRCFSTFPCVPSAGDVILAPQDEPDAAGSLQPIPSKK